MIEISKAQEIRFLKRSITPSLIIIVSLFLFSCASSRYETRDSAVVIASWYGPEFHGRPTASGEMFDMNRYTCAHREYPFGTILRIVNITNSRSVKCIVNDRGPFVQGRDLDLSYAAAREIGLIGQGVAPVKVEYIGRDVSYVKEVWYLASEGPFTIQLGSFREVENAMRLKRSLELKYSGVYITQAIIKGAVYYRVRIGKFTLRDDALGVAKTLAQEGYSPMIVKFERITKLTWHKDFKILLSENT